MFKSIYRVNAFVEGELCSFCYEIETQNELKALLIARKNLSASLGVERELIIAEIVKGA